ncbi:PRC-barrel domain-containing protein [Arenibacterium sp. LLYu02]|uniref:PRC-barrel domain-containing protein n=1 Tax=Arenibacterium sp. LLYu02 TaxID=3404132 RepID=UPI003B21C0B7
MKKLLISTSLVLALGLPAYASDTSAMFRSEAGPAEFQTSSFIGKRIYQTETDGMTDVMDGVQDGWKDIGEVNDVILSREGTVEAVLVDIGGFLGIGENQIAVDMDALQFVRDGSSDEGVDAYFLVLNAPADALKEAPTYDMSANTAVAPAATTDMAATADVNATADAELDNSTALTAETNMTAEAEATGDTALDEQVTGAYDTAATDEAAPVTGEFTAEELTGATAFDANEEHVGDVADLVLDSKGEVEAVIVDVGGFLGLGAKPVELDLEDVTIEEQDGSLRIYTMLTKQQMEELPEYQG